MCSNLLGLNGNKNLVTIFKRPLGLSEFGQLSRNQSELDWFGCKLECSARLIEGMRERERETHERGEIRDRWGTRDERNAENKKRERQEWRKRRDRRKRRKHRERKKRRERRKRRRATRERQKRRERPEMSRRWKIWKLRLFITFQGSSSPAPISTIWMSAADDMQRPSIQYLTCI